MTAQELNTYINRVLGNSIRCLLPSYWWKRLLTRIVEYVDGVDKKAVYSERFIKRILGVTIGTSEEKSATVYADGKKIGIPAGVYQKVRCSKSFMMDAIQYSSITSLDISLMDTSDFKSMYRMFSGCSHIESIDMSHFDTSKVTDMSEMFRGCTTLKNIDISSFDTSKVVYMDGMFQGLYYISTLVLNFDTSSVRTMTYMFADCSYDSPQSLDLSSFDTSMVEDMTGIFSRTSGIRTLKLGEGFFKTKKVSSIDFSYLWKWGEDSFIQSVVENSYDRASNGLPTLELIVNIDTYAFLTDEHISTLTNKGYTIVSDDPYRGYDG